MARARYTRIDDAAVVVWAQLEGAGPDGLDIQQLSDATGLTRPQIRKGIRRLKQVLQVPNRQPIACVQPGYRYVLTDLWPEQRDYIINRLHDLQTRLDNMEYVVEAAALKWGRAGTRRILVRQVTHLRENIDDLVEAAESDVSS